MRNVKIKSGNILLILIAGIIIISTKCFYLIDIDIIYAKILLGILIIFQTRNFNGKLYFKKYNFGSLMLFTVLLSLLSAWQGYRLYNQSVMDAMMTQSSWFLWALMYFPITKALNRGQIQGKSLKQLIEFIGLISLVVFCLQGIFSDTTFTYVEAFTQSGKVVYYFHTFLIVLGMFFSFSNYLNGKNKIYALIILAMTLYVALFVTTYRLTTASLILTILLGITISKKGVQSKFVYFIIGGILAYFIFQTEAIQDALTSIFDKSGSMSIRVEGRNLYLATLMKHPILGGGVIAGNVNAINAAGYNRYIYANDNGLYGFAYFYGLLGVSWFIYLMSKLYVFGFRILKNSNIYWGILFPIYFTITLQNEMHWYEKNGFIVLVLFICLLEDEYNKSVI